MATAVRWRADWRCRPVKPITRRTLLVRGAVGVLAIPCAPVLPLLYRKLYEGHPPDHPVLDGIVIGVISGLFVATGGVGVVSVSCAITRRRFASSVDRGLRSLRLVTLALAMYSLSGGIAILTAAAMAHDRLAAYGAWSVALLLFALACLLLPTWRRWPRLLPAKTPAHQPTGSPAHSPPNPAGRARPARDPRSSDGRGRAPVQEMRGETRGG